MKIVAMHPAEILKTEFWMNLQLRYELEITKDKVFDKIVA